MFSLERIEPVFTDDTYGFTQSLLNYINGDSNDLTEKDKLSIILENAYVHNSVKDQKTIQHALFLIYQIGLAHPLSAVADKQYDASIIEIKNIIEKRWLESEFNELTIPEEVNSTEHYGDYLKSVWQSHRASHHPVFDFLEKNPQ